MKKLQKYLLCGLILTLISCQSKETPETRETALATGFEMIDEKRFDEAEAYFTELLQKDPHPHVRLALASVYASRAQISFAKLYSFVAQRKNFQADIKLEGLSSEVQIEKVLAVLEIYRAHWDSIPKVTSAQNQDLQKALQILSQDRSSGLRLYSASLRLLLLKNSIDQGVQNWNVLSKKDLCADQLRPYVAWAVKVLDGLTQMAEDLEIAFPKQKDQYEKFQKDLKKISTDAQNISWPKEKSCL